MKSKLLFIAALLLLLLGTGCSKTNPNVFSWNYLGRHYVADSGSVSSTPDNRILAYSGQTALAIDGGGKLAVGTYTLHNTNTTGMPYLFYVSVATYIYSRNGSLTITANDNTQISGYFTATLTDSSYITGSFTNLPYQ